MALSETEPERVETYKRDLQRMLRSVRMACGFTQDDIAAILHINRATYTNYETGKVFPDLITLMKLGMIFQIPPESFLHPDAFTDLGSTRQRASHVPAIDPQKVGDLSSEEKKMIADYRTRTNSPIRPCDRMTRGVQNVLSQFIIKKTYMGYPFLVSAIREAVTSLPDRLTTTEICELVAADEKTTSNVVARELKRMVNNIWHHTDNPTVYGRIAGQEVVAKPLPVEFIYTLADYLAGPR